MDIRLIAAFLLTFRLVSIAFMLIVIAKQLRLVRRKASFYIRRTRVALLVLSITIFIGNLIPIYVDYATIFAGLVRSTDHVNPVGVLYSLDNSLTAMLSSIAMWAIYKLAEMAARAGENNLDD